MFPFLDYNVAYAGYNYYKISEEGTLDAGNLKMIRTFEGGPDENGFPSVHIAMQQHSGKLVSGCVEAFEAIEKQDRGKFDASMIDLSETLQSVN